MNRERFEDLAKLKGMDVTRANRRITFVNLEVIEAGGVHQPHDRGGLVGMARGNDGGW